MKQYSVISTLNCGWILLALHLSPVSAQAAGGRCNATHYQCVNGNCVDYSKVNNTINDCGDNTDEGYLRECLQSLSDRWFKCTEGGCISLGISYNGYMDCNDNSDEVRLIGYPCSNRSIVTSMQTTPRPGSLCCPCNQFVANSYCDVTTAATASSIPPGYDVRGNMNGICRCVSGYIANQLNSECTKRVIGDACQLDADCYDAVSSTVCNGATSRCECAPGYYKTSQSSCAARLIGHSCRSNVDCSSVIANSSCSKSSNLCVCNHGYVASVDNTTCNIPTIGTLRCAADSDCSTYFNLTVCNPTNGRCQCQRGYYVNPAATQCLRYKLGDVCYTRSNDDCTISVSNSSCTGSRCTCATGYRQVSDINCVSRIIGDVCSQISDCMIIPNSDCISGRCQCRGAGYQQTAAGTYCSLRHLNDSCTELRHCLEAVNNSLCSVPDMVCRCAPGFKTSSSGNSCDRKSVGDQCTDDTDCLSALPDVVCSPVTRSCECRYGYRTLGGDQTKCLPIPINELDCIVNEQCSNRTADALCGQNRKCHCSCGAFFSSDFTTCEQPKVGLTTCQSDDRCSMAIPMSTCISGRCQCRHGYFATTDSKACVSAALNSTTCQQGSLTCQQAVQFSECSPDNVCRCVAGYRQTGSRICSPIVAEKKCAVDDECTGLMANSKCSLPVGQCACADGYSMAADGAVCLPSNQLIAGVCPTCPVSICGVIVGLVIGAILGSVTTFLIMYRKKLRKLRKVRKVAPATGAYGSDRTWRLDWNNRPGAHVPVMYKTPSLRPPDELYEISYWFTTTRPA